MDYKGIFFTILFRVSKYFIQSKMIYVSKGNSSVYNILLLLKFSQTWTWNITKKVNKVRISLNTSSVFTHWFGIENFKNRHRNDTHLKAPFFEILTKKRFFNWDHTIRDMSQNAMTIRIFNDPFQRQFSPCNAITSWFPWLQYSTSNTGKFPI